MQYKTEASMSPDLHGQHNLRRYAAGVTLARQGQRGWDSPRGLQVAYHPPERTVSNEIGAINTRIAMNKQQRISLESPCLLAFETMQAKYYFTDGKASVLLSLNSGWE